MKKMLTLLLTLMLLLTALPTMATAPDTAPFIIDVSAMSAEAQKAWNDLFRYDWQYGHKGDVNSSKKNIKEMYVYLQKGSCLAAFGTGNDVYVGKELIFSTNVELEEGHDIVHYLDVFIEGDHKVVNDGNYNPVYYQDRIYFYLNFHSLASQLLLPSLEENKKDAYKAIDVYITDSNGALYKGVITAEFSDKGYKLVMKPVE